MNYPLAKTVRIDFREPVKFLAIPQMKGFAPKVIIARTDILGNSVIWPWDDETTEQEKRNEIGRISSIRKAVLIMIVPIIVILTAYFIARHFRRRR